METQPAPNKTVPEPFDTVYSILAHIGDTSFTPEEVIALLSSHAVAGAVHPRCRGRRLTLLRSSLTHRCSFGPTEQPFLGPAVASEAESPLNGELRLQGDHEVDMIMHLVLIVLYCVHISACPCPSSLVTL